VTIQIAVRLPDEILEFVDQQVADGAASSRAAVVTRALEHERRRLIAEKEAQIDASLHSTEFDSLASWAATRPMDID
jgi:Arc/MetJ-type ribon-helix-helix transcriptional regulator